MEDRGWSTESGMNSAADPTQHDRGRTSDTNCEKVNSDTSCVLAGLCNHSRHPDMIGLLTGKMRDVRPYQPSTFRNPKRERKDG